MACALKCKEGFLADIDGASFETLQEIRDLAATWKLPSAQIGLPNISE